MAIKKPLDPRVVTWRDLSERGQKQLLPNRGAIVLGRVLLIAGVIFVALLFLPWRQTIPGRGTVSALRPEDRPQTIQNQIGGRIEHWAVKEGDEVRRGDTLLVISEIVQSYFDPELPIRLEEQLEAKRNSETAADQKMVATEAQISALTNGLQYQLESATNSVEQARNVVKIDSADLTAMQIFLETSVARLERYEQGYRDGLFSLTDIETRRLNLQNDKAKVISAENKLSNSRQSFINAKIELNNIRARYNESLAKAQSDLGSAFSSKASARGDISKIRNEIANIDVRRGLYIVRAPQDGFIVKTLKAGIGETIKDGESVATLQSKKPLLAAEVYINAMDVPLVGLEDDARLQFEGWPSIQFSGWPSVAIGTFAGTVTVIDKVSSRNGQYRLLIRPAQPVPEGDENWPKQLRLGSGVHTRIILNRVPLWYEIWRQLNGFPPSLEQEQGGHALD
ncbi:HlyD family secretion protein [Sphingobacterium sp. lm-10]|uniref:HlyD family secretion protein n=1 Tax=Sphingobacterium sp. lm-10 TaxID=2944904 RepID=UPI00202256A6|nr:biotin/lipoyl-binding protein [Sphingobacterium sp. lm-10]MCL7989083.1 HlyD family secretion protein [Sphingobacterium sp. lm-10]